MPSLLTCDHLNYLLFVDHTCAPAVVAAAVVDRYEPEFVEGKIIKIIICCLPVGTLINIYLPHPAN